MGLTCWWLTVGQNESNYELDHQVGGRQVDDWVEIVGLLLRLCKG